MNEDGPMTPLQNTIGRRSVLKIIGAAAWPAVAPIVSVAQPDIIPFRIHVSDGELADLRRRLSNVRWPPDATGKPWSMGTDRAYLQQLIAYWRGKYKRRTQETGVKTFGPLQDPLEGRSLV